MSGGRVWADASLLAHSVSVLGPQENIVTLERKLSAQAEQLAQASEACTALAHRASAAEARAATSEARALEIEKRANDLRTELSLAHANAEHARRSALDKADRAESQIAHLNEALMRRSDADVTRSEEVTRLKAQLEVVCAEHQALLAVLKPNGAASAVAGDGSANRKRLQPNSD